MLPKAAAELISLPGAAVDPERTFPILRLARIAALIELAYT
jgi:hypothetical protein